ncbi:MAG: hypothetical protein WCG80_19410 [Spirochaetales bacterium]
MRKFALFAALVSFVLGGAAFAADAKAAVKTVTGTVVSFKAADPAKKTPDELVVKVGTKDETFVLDAKTVFTGKDKKAFLPATLKKGEKVEVAYTEDAKKVLAAVTVTLK